MAFALPAAAADVPDLGAIAGADAGLVVVVDPAGVNDVIRLAKGGRHVVAVLEDKPDELAARQEALQAAKVAPAAQAHRWWFRERLPFRARSVNVVVLHAGLEPGLLAEAERIVAPGHGVVLIEQDGRWQERRVPRPEGMGVWLSQSADGGASYFSPDRLLTQVDSVQFFHGGDRLRGAAPFIIDDRILVQAARNFEGRDAFTGALRWRLDRGIAECGIAFLTDRHFWWLERDSNKTGEGTLHGVDRLSGAAHRSIALGPFMPFKGQDHDATSRMFRIASDGRIIYATGGYKRITAHDAASGRLLWQQDYEHFVECLAVSGDLLVAQLCSTGDSPRERGFAWNCNVAEAVIGIDAATGALRWRNGDCKGLPSNNLAADGEKVVACSFLPPGGVPERRAEVDWYKERLFLQVIERKDGATRFMRRDFKELHCSRTNQWLALWPGRVGVLKDNDLSLFDASDGRVLGQYRGPGYHLCSPAVTATHLWTGNAAIPMDDSPALDMHGFDLACPPYGHRNAVANGMLYTPSHQLSVSSETSLGSAAAMVMRRPEDRQPLPWDDPRRQLRSGRAAWSASAPGDWPTLRGDGERGAWLGGDGPLPTRVAWTWQPAEVVDPGAAKLLRQGWQQHGGWVGPLSQPVADGRRVLVVQSAEGRLVCLDRAGGTERWSRRFGGRIGSPPTLAGGIAFLGCEDGTVSAVNLEDGALVWQFLAAPGADLVVDHDQVASLYPALSSPLLHSGALFVSTGRHSQLEQGIALWKLDPASGRPLGRSDFNADWVAALPDDRTRTKPFDPKVESGSDWHPRSHPRTMANDLLQLRDGAICLVDELVDPGTMAIQPHAAHSPRVQHIGPARGGILGGVRWVRSGPLMGPGGDKIWQGYRLANVKTRASHVFTADAMLINRQLGMFAMTTEKVGGLIQLPLGFDNEAGRPLITANTAKLPTDRMRSPLAVAGRGDRLYLAAPHFDGRLHLLVIDRKNPGVALADLTSDLKDEQPVPDGIAVTADAVYLATASGRLIAFAADR